MEISPNQVQHVLRTYNHLIKPSAAEATSREAVEEPRQDFDSVLLSLESSPHITPQTDHNEDSIPSE